MQIQPPNVPEAGTDSESKTWAFRAHIVSVDFVDSEPMTRDGAIVSGPHWTLADKKNCQEDWAARAKRILARRKWYSKKPAAYAVSTLSGKCKVKVEIEITKSENVSGSAALVGSLGPIKIEGTCSSTSKGKQKIDAKITAWEDHIDSRFGNLAWTLTLSTPSATVGLGVTFVELYLLLAAPVTPMYDAGLPAEVMRYLSQKALRSGPKTKEKVGELVTFHLFAGRKLTYDTEDGSSSYSVDPRRDNPAFRVADCALRKWQTVNCYDQAASVQTMCGAVGVDVKFIYMRRYGFISAPLVGVGKCNNPFHRDPTYSNQRYLNNPNDVGRSGFGNHAFDDLAAMILDACAGPHLGTENLDDYIKNAIDHTTTLNAMYGLPGTRKDTEPPVNGIVGINPAVSV